MIMKQYLIPILIVAAMLTGCGESESARRERELEHARLLAQIEVEKEKSIAELRQKLKEDEQRRIQAERDAETRKLQDEKLKLVRDLTFTTRTSLLDENDKVLQIRNPNPQSIDIYLKCYTPSGYSKTIFTAVPALNTVEVGILEGWNFRSGEKFEVIYNESIVHKYTIN